VVVESLFTVEPTHNNEYEKSKRPNFPSHTG